MRCRVRFERLGLDQAAKVVGQLVRHLVSEPDEAPVPSGVDPQPTQADDPALAIDVREQFGLDPKEIDVADWCGHIPGKASSLQGTDQDTQLMAG